MVSVSSLFVFYYFKYTYFIVSQNVQLLEALNMPFLLLCLKALVDGKLFWYGLSFSLVISFPTVLLYCLTCRNDHTERFYFA